MSATVSRPDAAPERQPVEPMLDGGERSFRDFLHTHRRGVLMLFIAVVIAALVLVVLPQVAGFGHTLTRLRQGNKTWLAVGLAFEVLSIAGYVAIFRAVFSCEGVRINWNASYQITLAGVVATKLFAAAGAGGVALTAWALRASGLEPRLVAQRMTSFEILLYAVYMGSLVIFGVGLATGALDGDAPAALTVLPAIFGAVVIALVLAFRLVPSDLEARIEQRLRAGRRRTRLLTRLATVPRTLREGVITAVDVLRHPQPGLIGGLAYWAFDIATLWTAFRAFGATPEISIVVMGYFVGMLGNAIPIPGGIGGVEGGMIGAFIAFGINGSTAVVAVLAYRALSFWLPTLPGAVAYFQLRRTVARWHEQQPQQA